LVVHSLPLFSRIAIISSPSIAARPTSGRDRSGHLRWQNTLAGFRAGGFPPSGRTCTDDTASTNFLTRTGGSAPNYGAGSARYADAICTFIKALETASLITGNLSGAAGCGGVFDAIYLIKAHTSANAALNICGTGYSLVNHGAIFTADVGYAGASSSYVDTQFDPTTGTTKFLQNDASFSAATSTRFIASTDYGSMCGNSSGTLVIRLYPHYSDNSFYSGINQTVLRGNPVFLRGIFIRQCAARLSALPR
jgi:hypothetical protein